MSDHRTHDELDRELLASIIRRYEDVMFVVNRRINTLLRKAIGDEEITTDQFATLLYLRKHGRSTSSELSEHFCVGKSSITAIIARMFDKKLIARTPDEQDRRVTYLTLTEAGGRLADEIEDRIGERLAAVMNRFARAEALQFIETYEKLADVLTEQEGKD